MPKGSCRVYPQEAIGGTAEERANRIDKEVFQTYLNDGIMSLCNLCPSLIAVSRARRSVGGRLAAAGAPQATPKQKGVIIMKLRYLHEEAPPRTFVPKILAALAAGVVTLGALPAAHADPTVNSNVTSDVSHAEGVAGSTSGAASTITVGTEGGGTAPKIFYSSKYTPIFGTWRQGTTVDGTITVTGDGTASNIYSGSFCAAFATHAKLTKGGNITIDRANITIADGTFKLNTSMGMIIERGVIGGFAFVNSASGATKANAKVTKSEVLIKKGDFTAENNRIFIAGGMAYTQVAGVLNQVNASSNKLTIEAGSFSNLASLYGGLATTFTNGSVEGTASNNHLNFTSDSTVRDLAGGYTFASGTVGTLKLEANGNHLTAKGAAYRFYGGYAMGQQSSPTPAGTSAATANDNVVTIEAGSGTFSDESMAGYSDLQGPKLTTVTTEANGNTLNISGGTFNGAIFGGKTVASTSDGSATATAKDNKLNISGGTYQSDIYAGYALDKDNKGTATAKDNTIVIAGSPDLSAARLYGGYAAGQTRDVSGNALDIHETKGISVESIAGFQKIDFWLPAGMTKDDTMLSVTSTDATDLSATAITAHLHGDETETRLRLLHTQNATITKNGATTLAVWKGVSDATVAKIGITKDNKELIVKTDGSDIDDDGGTTPTPTPSDLERQILDSRKSIVETMAGSAAFLGTGANLMAGAGMTSASVEAATAEGFSPFAAIGGASMRHETGSHVTTKGMNLAVGFSREVRRGDDRLLFGPVVEYGRGSYDSYVNDAHGDGTVRYIGAGGFVRQERRDGTFCEGSLRFGRSSMDYAANLAGGHTSYDTDANYIGAHLGFGQKVTEESGNERELYVRYFYTRQNGTDATLSTGERYDFDAVDSHRLRTGARWTIPQAGGSLILGASAQYEFGGEANATVHVGGLSYTTPAPSIKGFSGSLELGWKAQMSENATADLAVEGWLGKQRGVSLRAGFAWQF
ncbi:MAG: hypothetical protein ACTTJE_07165 [Schwartzia sp. (in: firmicutes)]